MFLTKTVCAAALAALLVSPIAPAAADTPPLSPVLAAKVDALFSKWDSPNTPGAALGIVRDGKLVYARGYGSAILEAGTPITPATVFHVASDSKQFTAFAIMLLEQAGKLSRDDDVHKYIPELPDYGAKITIRQLLSHTSGVRDQWNLLALAGWRLEDVITDDDVLAMLMRQKSLNSPPGEKWNYSNGGYSLLALIVQRISGKSLADFAMENIFKPLGMTHTHFQTDYGTVVKDRAYSYVRDEKGEYRYVALSYSTVGPSSLFTTVEDLARWDQNFYDARVGGAETIAKMQEPATLNNGASTGYAAGLQIADHRGLKTVEHSGGDAGFRSDILRFPEQHVSVIVLGNTDLAATGLAYRVADLVLGDALAAPKTPAAATAKHVALKTVAVSDAVTDQYLGRYVFDFGLVVEVAKRDGKLFEDVGDMHFLLTPVAGGAFAYEDAVDRFSITFAKGKTGAVETLVVHKVQGDFPAGRLSDPGAGAAETKAYEGDYYSDELGVVYRVATENGALVVHHPRGPIKLQRIAGGDGFLGDYPLGRVQFTRGADGAADGFTVDDGRVQGLRFSRVRLSP